MSRSADEATEAEVFAALGDATRLLVVRRLAAGGDASITQLVADHAISRQALTKHLSVLEGAGLVSAERRGRERVFSLERPRLVDAGRLLEEVGAAWDERLARLHALLSLDTADAESTTPDLHQDSRSRRRRT